MSINDDLINLININNSLLQAINSKKNDLDTAVNTVSTAISTSITNHIQNTDPHSQYVKETDIGSAALFDSSDFATPEQGTKADNSIQKPEVTLLGNNPIVINTSSYNSLPFDVDIVPDLTAGAVTILVEYSTNNGGAYTVYDTYTDYGSFRWAPLPSETAITNLRFTRTAGTSLNNKIFITK